MLRHSVLPAIGLFLLAGCTKEQLDPNQAAGSSAQDGTKTMSVYVLGSNADGPTYTLTDVDISEHVGVAKNNGNSAHAHADITLGGGTFSFQATRNNGGTHGNGEFRQVLPGGIIHVRLTTVSLIVQGDTAVYIGQVSEVLENTVVFPPPPPGFPAPPPPFAMGSYVYAQVIDNGEGVNAPADRYSNFLGNGTFLPSNGGLGLPWSLFGYSDVMPDDMVKVN